MPADVTAVVIGIVLAFVAFGAALAWTDYYARDYRKPPT